MSDPANTNPKSDDQRKLEGRRAALKTMGVVAAYTAPVLLATSIPTRAARASGGTGGGGGGGGGGNAPSKIPQLPPSNMNNF